MSSAIEKIQTALDNIENKTAPSHKMIPFEFVDGESVKDISKKT